MNAVLPDDNAEIAIRRCMASDREALLVPSERLMTGIAPWRDPDACLQAVRGWIEASMARAPEDGALFVATDAAGELLASSASRRAHTSAVSARHTSANWPSMSTPRGSTLVER